jgi:hypothetical protein
VHPVEHLRHRVGSVENVAVRELDSRHRFVVFGKFADRTDGTDVPGDDAHPHFRLVVEYFEEWERSLG